MKNPIDLSRFAKGNNESKRNPKRNAVIYTRVSSKEQAENLSLETQLKGCKAFAVKTGLNVLECFGGTYESAKSDDRKEFNRMLAYVRRSKEPIGYIIVYSLERFSRTGDGAISIASELKKQGITVLSATQPIDSSNPSGTLQQNMLFLFSQFDNELRRQKCIAGMKEKMLKGEWVGGAPLGYSYDRTSVTTQRIVLNDKATLVKRMFELKAYDRLSNSQIAEQISRLGLKIDRKRVTQIIGNPFYCGFITHSLLDGEIIKGNHPALISEELFLQANGAIKESKQNVSGYKQTKVNVNVPLRHFAFCEQCNKPMTAYLVKAKGLYYYKCNTVGCNSNTSANVLHNGFKQLLADYQIDQMNLAPLKAYLLDLYNVWLGQTENDLKSTKTKLGINQKRTETVVERFAFGEIDREVYETALTKLKIEKTELEAELGAEELRLSNPELAIDKALKISSDLVNLWDSGAFHVKTDLQEILFPKGIHYNRKNNTYRTEEINEVLTVTRSFTNYQEQNKKGQTSESANLSSSVVPTGLLSAKFDCTLF